MTSPARKGGTVGAQRAVHLAIAFQKGARSLIFAGKKGGEHKLQPSAGRQHELAPQAQTGLDDVAQRVSDGADGHLQRPRRVNGAPAPQKGGAVGLHPQHGETGVCGHQVPEAAAFPGRVTGTAHGGHAVFSQPTGAHKQILKRRVRRVVALGGQGGLQIAAHLHHALHPAVIFQRKTGQGRSVQRAYKQAKLAFHLKAFMRKDRLRRFKADRLGQAGVCGVPVGAAL